jgi:hypothetical protein
MAKRKALAEFKSLRPHLISLQIVADPAFGKTSDLSSRLYYLQGT